MLSKINIKDIQLIPVGYVREALSTFYLLGNQFTITIKNIESDEPAVRARIAEAIAEIAEIGGIPNFFGHQRFGTTRPITHYVGKALLHGNFEEAAMLFLAKPSPHEHPNSRQARQQLQETRTSKRHNRVFPGSCVLNV